MGFKTMKNVISVDSKLEKPQEFLFRIYGIPMREAEMELVKYIERLKNEQ